MREFDEREWAELENQLAKIGNGVTRELFEAWLKIGESQAQLDAQYGAGEWTLVQALDLMVAPPARRRNTKHTFEQGTRRSTSLSGGDRSYKATKAEGEEASGGKQIQFDAISREEFEARVEARLKEYTGFFTGITPNDMALLRNLSYVEVNIEILNALGALEYSKSSPDGAAILPLRLLVKGLGRTGAGLAEGPAHRPG